MSRSSQKNTPKKLSKLVVTIVIVVAAAVLIGGIKFFKWSQTNASAGAAARTLGDPKAAVRVTEFVDFQCPACAYGAKQLKEYFKIFPGKIYLEVKYFPLGGHVHSLIATKYVECSARQGKFWPYFELVFERQKQWQNLLNAHSAFEAIAQEIEVNENKFRACLASDEILDYILKDKDEGQKLGVSSTPTYFINGKMVVGAKLMIEEVEKILGKPPEAGKVQGPAGN